MKACSAAIALATMAWVWSVAAVAADFAVPRAPTARVTDTAGVLSSETRDAVENQLRNYENATGHQIIVWIGQTTGDVPLEDWTGETAHTWKIGRRGHDDGAVLFLFMQDHKVRVEVGYGLESALTDADSKRIIEEQIVPRMRAGDPDGAVKNGVAAILTTITPSYAGVTPPPAAEQPGTLGTGAGIAILAAIVLGFGFMIFLVIMQVIGSMRYGYLVLREGSKQAKLDMRHWWFWGGAGGGFLGGSASSFGGDGGDFDGGGFSGGGGDFGGGGASGGW